MIRSLLSLAITAIVSASFAQTQDAPKEAGKYERKSVTFINALWLMDESAHRLSGEQVGFVLDKVKQGITMKRFDYNPVPESFVTDFVNQANSVKMPPAPVMAQHGLGALGSGPDPMLDTITAIMERTVVPKILEVVDLAKEMRAGNLTSEQQRNSFMSDKAKTMGITMEDIDKVMNSAYIYIPLIRNFSEEMRDSAFTLSFDAGIIWFRINAKGEKAKAIPVVRKFTFSSGFGRLGKAYASSTGLLDYKQFAFRSATKNAVRNLIVATQEIPEFRLSGQVLEQGFMNVSFDLGKNEGVKIDDKYHIVEFTEEADGKISEKKSGWVMVTSVGDSNSKQGYKSKAQVIGGSPFTGAVLSEFPRIPIDIVFKGRMFAFTQDSVKTTNLFDSLKLTNAYGAGIDAQYNIGRSMGIPQLFFDVGFGIGWGSASGKMSVNGSEAISGGAILPKFTSTGCMTFEGSFVKKFYFGRLALMIQPTFTYQTVSVFTDKLNDGVDDMYYRAINSNLGFTANAGLEFALGAAVNFGVGAGYQLLGTNASWELDSKVGSSGSWSQVSGSTYDKDLALNHTGLTAQVYFTWSVPALPFDPIDMIRANAGL